MIDPAIQKAEEKLTALSHDSEFLRLYHLREKALAEWNSDMDQFRKESKLEKTQEIAGNLKHLGIPLDQIAQATGLSVDEVEQL
jgi:predicted transposase/invertase (TIGR01784 family)